MVRKLLVGLALAALLIVVGIKIMNKTEKNIKIALSGPWKSVHPGLQSTAAADMVLSNQFESLIGYNENGSYVPLGAKSWKVNDDFTVFEFEIDTTRKFSDGTNLSAQDYKHSWEQSLLLQPKSTNNSLLDVLYKIKGFENFEVKNEISGISAIDDKTLRLEFKSPFRMALEHLTGSRFSAYKTQGSKFLGTGVFIISEISEKELALTPNEYYLPRAKYSISLFWDTFDNLHKKILNGELDVIHQATGFGIDTSILKAPNISAQIGSESRHLVMELNKNTFFSKKENRQAFQFLLYNYLKNKSNQFGDEKIVATDFQVMLPFQKGHISNEEVSAIIEKQNANVERFLAEVNNSEGLLVVETKIFNISKILKELNIKISPKSYTVELKQMAETRHKNNEYDLFPTVVSVVSGDPDGLYHVFGKNGAIASKYSVDQKVSDALEEGRKIIKIDDTDAHYQEVSKLILTEVPMIHLGFTKNISIHRNDRVNVNAHVIKRNDGHLDIYELN